MGCDIHFYVERREGGTWVSADTWEQDEYEPSRLRVPYDKAFYRHRNYDLFAILADVRNGYGFAGVDTGDGLVPIAAPRGLPDDVTALVRGESESWGVDGHSHSWVKLQELLDYDWTRTTKKRGWLSAIEYFEWDGWSRENGREPKAYSGGVSGFNVKHITEEEMRTRITTIGKDTDGRWNRDCEALIKEQLANYYCQCEWTQPYYDLVEEFLAATVFRLLRLGKPEDVRIVFWFDN